MAATKYQVLYRFMNTIFDTPITNSFDTKYEPLFEFYTDPDHRIFSSDTLIQNEEMEKQQAIITEANSAANTKYDMLFVFNGTKKIPHKRWITDQIGYVVRDWKSIRQNIGNNGDYSKEFTTIDGESPESGGTVVCTTKVMQKYFRPYSQTDFGGAVSSDTVQKAIINSTIFKLENEDWSVHAVAGANSSSKGSYFTAPGVTRYIYGTGTFNNVYQKGTEVTLYQSNIIIDPVEGVDYIKNYEVYPRTGVIGGAYIVDTKTVNLPIAWIGSSKMYRQVNITKDDLLTVTIPGHYEDSVDAPYVIKDQYKRIENSPWIVNCTVGSLDAALTKARILIDMIGIENVKIIKLVPFAQYVKIK